MTEQVSAKNRKPIVGRVVKCSSIQTIKVLVSRKKRHPKYVKIMNVDMVLTVHDENGVAKVGDMVSIQSCRPFSKTKSYELISIQNS